MRIKSTVIGILLTTISLVTNGQDTPSIQIADSLFASQKYTEAFDIYENILDADQASPSMLLKMAFIQDASGNYTDALFYLDLYYRTSADRHAVGKIEEIAEEHQLSGYQYDDTHYFLALFEKYKYQFIILLMSIAVMLLVYVARKSRGGEKSYAALIFQFFTVALLLLAINFQGTKNGIIANDQTLLRSGPSAGAEPLEVISKGHKVTIIERDDIWTKIIWDGDEAYVRNHRIKLI